MRNGRNNHVKQWESSFNQKTDRGNKGKEIKRLLPGTVFLRGFPTKLPSIITALIERERERERDFAMFAVCNGKVTKFYFLFHMFVVCIPTMGKNHNRYAVLFSTA